MMRIYTPFDDLIYSEEDSFRAGELQAEKDLEEFKNNLIKSFNEII